MENYNESNINEETSGGANGPVSVGKLKEYGMKAYAPLLNVVHKYQDEFTPYLDALSKGLQGGVDTLNKEDSNEAEKYVSQFFREAADGLNQACEKLKSKDVKELSGYLTSMAEKRPSIMFSTSYIAGVFFGRLARHVVSRQKKNVTDTNVTGTEDTFIQDTDTQKTDTSIFNNEPPTFDQSIH